MFDSGTRKSTSRWKRVLFLVVRVFGITHSIIRKLRPETLEIVCSAMEEGYSKRPYFITVLVRVSYCSRELLTYAMLNTGSQRTFCGAALAKKLRANGLRRSVRMRILSMGQKKQR